MIVSEVKTFTTQKLNSDMLVSQNNFKSEIKTIWCHRANMSLECREVLGPEAVLESKCAEARSAKDTRVHPKGRA